MSLEKGGPPGSACLPPRTPEDCLSSSHLGGLDFPHLPIPEQKPAAQGCPKNLDLEWSVKKAEKSSLESKKTALPSQLYHYFSVWSWTSPFPSLSFPSCKSRGYLVLILVLSVCPRADGVLKEYSGGPENGTSEPGIIPASGPQEQSVPTISAPTESLLPISQYNLPESYFEYCFD